MKTNAEWLINLPEPYRLKAIRNAERDDMLGMKSSSLEAALLAFVWETSPEGHAYWKKVFIKLQNNEL
jgi:hypothetical protein